MRILRPRTVAGKIGVSPTTLWRYQKRADFPKAFRVGPNAVGFDEDEIEAWIASLRVGRTQDAA